MPRNYDAHTDRILTIDICAEFYERDNSLNLFSALPGWVDSTFLLACLMVEKGVLFSRTSYPLPMD